MSFFERMMKMNNLQAKQNAKERQSIYNEEQTAPNRQQDNMQYYHQPAKQSSMKSSIAVIMDEEEQISDWEQLAQQPKIQPVYVTSMPVLLHHLLPKREQLMRQMLMKKQLQARRRLVCLQKKNQLQIKIEQDSLKFKNSLIKPPKKNSIKQSLKINELAESQASQKLDNSQVRKYSLKNTSANKQSKVLVLGQSTYSAAANPQTVSSPVADAFNRQIMLKLLNIIQKDRECVSLKPNLMGTEKKQKQRDAPIIINNIMKTPHESINKDLIDRELKIKILENTRLQRQKGSVYKNKNDRNTGYKSIARGAYDQNQQRVLTERTNLRTKIETVDFSASIKEQNSKSQKKGRQSFVESSLLQIERSSNKDKKGIRVFSDKKKQRENQTIEQQSERASKQNSLTKFNTSDKSNSKEQTVQIKQPKNKREFQKIRKQKKQTDTPSKQNNKHENVQKKPQQITNHPAQEYKPPVRIQIPLQNKSEVQGLTLAEAFKKKIGKLKSQKQAVQNKKIQKVENKHSRIQQIPSQMTITITQKLTEYNSKCDFQKTQSINLTTDDFPSKRTFTSKNLSKKTSIQKESVESRSNSKMKEPSDELVNRLIYGAKAKVTKEEMYALTRKNYANLPEVQAKKKQQEKRKAEQQRLNKAKEYQKAIRVGKSTKQL